MLKEVKYLKKQSIKAVPKSTVHAISLFLITLKKIKCTVSIPFKKQHIRETLYGTEIISEANPPLPTQ
jgi:hypothetical protein